MWVSASEPALKVPVVLHPTLMTADQDPPGRGSLRQSAGKSEKRPRRQRTWNLTQLGNLTVCRVSWGEILSVRNLPGPSRQIHPATMTNNRASWDELYPAIIPEIVIFPRLFPTSSPCHNSRYSCTVASGRLSLSRHARWLMYKLRTTTKGPRSVRRTTAIR